MRTCPFILALLATTTAFAGDADIDAAKAFVKLLGLAPTLQSGDVTVVPLRHDGGTVAPKVVPLWKSKKTSFAEPEFPRRRYDVMVSNGGDTALYLSGGTVLVGGKIDRLVRHDHLIAPGASCEIRTLPAASSADTRKSPTPFEVSPVLAPLYLRAQAEFGGSNSLVPNFVAKWIEFRNEGDKRKSLDAIVASTTLREYVVAPAQKLETLPEALNKPSTVGAVSAIHGRIQSLAVYGTNELLAEGFPPAVKGATYAAAAIAIRSKVAKIPLPGRGEPDKRKELVRQDAQKLLDMLQKATYRKDKKEEGEVGASIQIRLMDGTRGRVTVLDGAVVHLILYPKDPFRQQLYGRAIDVPDEKADPEAEPVESGDGSTGGDYGSDLSDDEKRFIGHGRRGGRAGRGGGGRRR